MLSNAKKIICSWVALAVLLVPLEFAFAHDISNVAQEMMAAHHHAEADMNHHNMDVDVTESECGSQNLCSDCVYCSPALNVSNRLQLGRLPGVEPVATVSLHDSIDLPVDIRPPKLL